MSDATTEEVFDVVAATAPEIRATLVDRVGFESEENPSGEKQIAADVHADRLLEERLRPIDGVNEYASEERDELVTDGDGEDEGYGVAVDPVDGSSNIETNNAAGTIVGIYDGALPASGDKLVGAAYVLYGPRTTMVAATEGSVTEYVIEDGDRAVVREDVRIPDEAGDKGVFGFGGRVSEWPAEVEAFVREIEQELKLRYSGAMIGDINQVLSYGGIFAYPPLRSAPESKLRLLYEGNPIGYIVEAAGGRSSDGDRSILEVPPEDLHQRVPVHIGTTEYVDRLEAALD
ncbi:class 1 fructose-bisphosphatase [Natronococcus sp. A-GB7]|uniref:class 1 fructose-bisphosphatase n=1 Tax=Natronococcus sp. A-GB7 TaxID=3037649 RepID=UPI00241EEAE4|nr:class 1 fructose-bisphosphatase [Natronococcus sp. A-GB7]MDG5818403.1 fructose-1,6-bisphosphatase [Natronococcus sp. A-GB7]